MKTIPGLVTEETPFAVMRRTWQPVAIARDLPEGGVRSFTLLGEVLVIARIAGKLLAARRNCPHKGFDLSRGKIGDGKLQCPYHGWQFDGAGACVGIPSMELPPAGTLSKAHLQTFAAQERYGMIWVRLADDEIAPLPDVPEFENPAWTYCVATPMPFACGFRREIENYVDMTHFAFAHSGTLGVAANTVVPEMKIEELGDGFKMEAPFPALNTGHEQPGKLQQPHQRYQRCYLPNFTTIRQSFPDGDQRVLLHVPSPNSQFECTVFWSLAISPGFRGPAPEGQMEFATRVLNEDRQMCEQQTPHEVPLNPGRGGWGVLVTPCDTLANTYQRCFRRFLETHAQA